MNALSIDAVLDTSDPGRLSGEYRVVELILEEVQGFGDALATGVNEKTTAYSRWLLAILTYCYAVGIYSSEDIEWACRCDPKVKFLATNTALDCETIRRFRRAHRPWIEACLIRVLFVAGSLIPGQTRFEVLPDAARQKLEMAIMMDTAMSE